MNDRDPRIDLTEKLFEAWSSGDADTPKPYLSPDCVLYDIVGGEHVGWDAIRGFFAQGLTIWTDLVLLPEQYWTSGKGVACNWVMSATVQDEMFGPKNKGKKWRSEGMSFLEFNDGVVTREVDYHDRGAVAESLAAQNES